jgi:hypothetical protein
MPRQLAIRNVSILAGLQALLQTGMVMIITSGGLAGHMLAIDKSLATLPISFLMIGTMITTIPKAARSQKF